MRRRWKALVEGLGKPAIALVLLFAFWFLLARISPGIHKVIYVVPNGYQGKVTVWYDPKARPIPRENGTWRVVLDKGGNARVNKADLDRLSDWTESLYLFTDGQKISVWDPVEPDKNVGWWVKLLPSEVTTQNGIQTSADKLEALVGYTPEGTDSTSGS